MSAQLARLYCRRPANSRGFTLIELLITLAVLAIVTTIAAPNLATWITNTRVRTAASDLYASMIYARSEATKRNENVDIIANAGGWNTGWRIEAGGTVLRQQEPLSGELTITEANNLTTVTYRRDGRLDGNAGATFTIASATNPSAKTRTVGVDLSGRPRVQQ
ncbi:MAG: GspH/FimT family pseudopilin [Burkholderiales bacterium]